MVLGVLIGTQFPENVTLFPENVPWFPRNMSQPSFPQNISSFPKMCLSFLKMCPGLAKMCPYFHKMCPDVPVSWKYVPVSLIRTDFWKPGHILGKPDHLLELLIPFDQACHKFWHNFTISGNRDTFLGNPDTFLGRLVYIFRSLAVTIFLNFWSFPGWNTTFCPLSL